MNSWLEQAGGLAAQNLLLRIGAALAALLAGWLLARLTERLLQRLLRRAPLDRITGTVQEILPAVQAGPEQLAKLLGRAAYWVVLLLFIYTAAERLQLPLLSEQIRALIAYLPRLAAALLVLGVGLYLARAVRGLVADVCKSFGVAAWKGISGAAFGLLAAVVAITALQQAGIDTTLLTSNLSILLGAPALAFSIAYGLAARSIVADLLAAYYLRQRYEPGMQIEVDGIRGEIESLDRLHVVLRHEAQQIRLPWSLLLRHPVRVHRAAETGAVSPE